MSVKTELSKLGSGSGIIYLTDSDGVFTGINLKHIRRKGFCRKTDASFISCNL